MKYFIDTEFIEGPQRERFPISLFRKHTPNTIDLISIGIVAEDGREYYAISKDFNLKEAWNRFQVETTIYYGDLRNRYPNGRKQKIYWLRQNVLLPIWRDLFFKADAASGLSNRQTEVFYQEINRGEYDQYFTFESFKYMIGRFGKSNKEIADEVKHFCSMGTAYSSMDKSISSVMHFAELGEYELEMIKEKDLKFVFNEVPEFYAYYADYDWVVFCWLFGKMMDLPKGFPMYCKDLKQTMDEKSLNISPGLWGSFNCTTFHDKLNVVKSHPDYPKQENEHSAIDDARWNKKLYEFLTQI